jgi:hypothetical protein
MRNCSLNNQNTRLKQIEVPEIMEKNVFRESRLLHVKAHWLFHGFLKIQFGRLVLRTDHGTIRQVKFISVGFLQIHRRRLCKFAQKLETEYGGRSVLCVSHAASVALVAALLRTPDLQSVGKFAPCGVFKLVRRGQGPWDLVQKGELTFPQIPDETPS